MSTLQPKLFWRIAGYIVWVVLLILAVYFFRERTLFVDIAYQTCLMIQSGTFAWQVDRYGAALVQALPLLAIKCNLPLFMVLMAYSVSFIFVYLFIYILLVERLGQLKLAWVLVALFTMASANGFYWTTSELQQGLAFLLLFFGWWLQLQHRGIWEFGIAGLCIISLVYYHPLIIFPFIFLWIFFLFDNSLPRNQSATYYILLVLVVVAILKSIFHGNWYDNQKYATFFANLVRYFPDYSVLKSNQKFIFQYLPQFFWLPIILFITAGSYVLRKQFLKCILMLSFTAGYIMLLNISSPNQTYKVYAEVNYMPIAIFICVPFIWDVLPNIRFSKIAFYLGVLIIAQRLFDIAQTHQTYTQRLSFLQHSLNVNHVPKQILQPSQQQLNTLIFDWGVPYETLLLSSLQHRDSAKTILVCTDCSAFINYLDKPNFFLSNFKIINTDTMQTKYFNLPKAVYKR